jgi:hypothetical protein
MIEALDHSGPEIPSPRGKAGNHWDGVLYVQDTGES